MKGSYDKRIFWGGIVLSIMLYGIGFYIGETTEAVGHSTAELLEALHWFRIGDKLRAVGICLLCMTSTYRIWKRR